MKLLRATKTALSELVETHNIALSIRRLRGSPYDEGRWKRALLHAVNMEIPDFEIRKSIREALKQP